MSTVSHLKQLIEDVQINGHSQLITVRSFRARAQLRRLSVVLYFHGGRFTSGTLDETHAACEVFALHAEAWVVSVGYSLAPAFPFPGAVEDAHRALLWAKSEANGVRADKRHIAVAGHDAGGNIATCLAAIGRDRGDDSIRAQALLAPLLDPSMTRIDHSAMHAPTEIDVLQPGYRAYLPKFIHRVHPYAAPIESRRIAHLPAVFIASVEGDPLHIEAEHYASSLIAAGVPVECARFANTTRNGIAWHEPALLAASRFLQRHFISS